MPVSMPAAAAATSEVRARPASPARVGTRLATRARRRAVPLALVVAGAGAVLLSSLGFPLHAGWTTVVWWRVPADIWATMRSAHTILWGDLGGVYGSGTGLVAFPGAALLLLPAAAVSQALHLTESFPMALPHPTAWWVLGPYAALVSGVALVAADALAERLGVGRGRRALLAVAGAAVLFPVYGLWGHPEDAVAVGMLLFAAVAALDDRVPAAGWWAGLAVAVQPLVLLGLPVVAGVLGWRRLVAFAGRAAAPALAVVAVPLAAEPRATLHALADQPNFPLLDHVTPWTAMAPHLGGHGVSLAVAGGPGRLVAVALALALAPGAARLRHRPEAVVWLMAAGLGLRVLTESVLDPYYLWPPLAVALAAAARAGWPRWGSAALLAVATSAVAEVRLPWLVWWLLAAGGVVAVVGLAFPARVGARRSSSGARMPLGDEEEGSARGCPAGETGPVPAAW